MPLRFAFQRGSKRLLRLKVPEEAGAGQTEAEGTGIVWTPSRRKPLGWEQIMGQAPREYGAWPL